MCVVYAEISTAGITQQYVSIVTEKQRTNARIANIVSK